MNIFLTGGTGFIGKNFLQLAAKNNKIFAISRKKKNYKINNVKYLYGELSDNWDFYLKKSDVLIHFAAAGVKNQNQNINECIDFNIDKSLKLFLNAYKNHLTKWIVIGSSSEYGKTLEKNKRVSTNDICIPNNNYSITKKLFFDIVHNISITLNTRLIYFRLFPVYGSYEPINRLIPQLKEHAKKRKKITIHNSNIRIDYSYVGDVCRKILKATKYKNAKTKYPQVWNLCSGNITTLKKFLNNYINKNNIDVDIRFNKTNKLSMHHISNKKSIWK